MEGQVQTIDASRTAATPRKPAFVCGIGASAGGLEALERFFRSVPPDTGIAFVVVQHLSPDFDSLMDELLVRQTVLPVRTAEDGMELAPDAIYLLPPRKLMIVSEGRLRLTDKDPKQGLTLPIDVFFRSLAEDCGAQSIAVVLSGTGSDGSRGVRDIHQAGGLVLVQSEETAKFDGMPRSALETGVVDIALAPEEIAGAIARYAKHPVPADLTASHAHPRLDDSAMDTLLRLLRDAYKIDFSHYKQSTVNRRIERRLLMNQSLSLEQYVDQLAADPDELNSLYHDLLIGVTQFFRDREAFAVLDRVVLPSLLQRLDPDKEMRIWVAGCATGEEAYSLAILVHEHMTRRGRPLNVKIFATDVHPRSLDVAAAGCYKESTLADVSEDRLRQYFLRKGDEYQVTAELRQMVVFAPHNILKDAPFTRLDLVSCRNLLIYFQPAAQKRVLSLLHFGLKPDGVLFLGPSEGLGELETQFTHVDRHWKLFRKRGDIRLDADLRLPTATAGLIGPPRLPAALRPARTWQEGELLGVYDELLDSFMPPGVLINSDHEIVHIFGDAARFLHLGTGRATLNVLEMFDRELRTAVAGAIQKAAKQRKPVLYSGITLPVDGQAAKVRLGVRPCYGRGTELSHLLLTLEAEAPPPEPQDVEQIDLDEASRDRITTLEGELRSTQENLQATIEELETSNEELHATNEELVASNEELQSTNEELHSVNEELYTVNAEYQRKIVELSELTDDMQNLLENTEVGVVFLDRHLCIRKFTPSVSGTFNILPQDIGRPFDNFSHGIDYPNLARDVRAVLETGRPIERETRDLSGNWYLLRILPYQSTIDVEGVVITLVDIGSIKAAQAELYQRDQRLQGILEHAPAFMFIKDLDGRYLLANRQSQRVLGAAPEQVLGKTDRELLPRKLADQIEAHDQRVIQTGQRVQSEEKISRGGIARTYLSVRYPLRDQSGQISAVAGILTDITQRQKAERSVRESVRQRDRFLATLSHELRNPLAAIKNGVHVLQRLLRDDAAVQRVYQAVDEQVAQMARLMDDLLDISRIVQGKIEIRRAVFDLREACEASINTVRSIVTEHRHDLQVELPSEPLYVDGDSQRLAQVFINLLVNAAKYTPHGGAIAFKLHRDADTAVASVRDSGVGMSREMQARAFEPFVQSERTLDRSMGGMGIGLTLVRSLVEQHGGAVRVESKGRGRGTEFTVELPLSAEKPQPRAEEQLPAPTRHLRLLLVEDNQQLQETTKMLLELDGYQVSVASDGLSALTALEVEKPDVAFIDIGLPELDGYAVARRVRQHQVSDGTYLVALTGFGREDDRRLAREAGFDDHLTKPVDLETLNRLLRTVASREVRRQPPSRNRKTGSFESHE